jgi:D-lactate dehydrogenase
MAGTAGDQATGRIAEDTSRRVGDDLAELIGAEQVYARAIDLVRYASDASPYRLLPTAVAVPRDVADVRQVFGYCRRSGIPAGLRAAGTSLSGQAQTSGILIDVRRHWAGMVVEDEGRRLRVRPGTVLDHANQVLARYGRRLGPDPASGAVATLGGVIANNSSGMRCTLEQDAYHTVRSMTLVLASGAVIDTAATGAEDEFARQEPALARGLLELRRELLADPALADRVRAKFRIRNTVGYRLGALLDADTPLEIFRRLVVGSEGTLAFIAEAVLDTVPAGKKSSVAWIHVPSIAAAADLVPALTASGAQAVELMVASALIGAQQVWPGTPAFWADLPVDSAALLVEFSGGDDADLDAAQARVTKVTAGAPLLRPPSFTRDAAQVSLAWAVREGMLGLVGMMRPQGAALLTEDVCFPPDRLADAARDLMELLARHGFLPGVAGHAALGNLHFLLTPMFGKKGERQRYADFMSELADLVLDTYDGSLKAEHGTGVNMAPFVRREWGDAATELMWRIKRLADPDGILAPGVVLEADPEVHLRNLKSTPPIEPIADRCIECGLCEAVCPSRDLTTTPRQRIAIRREMERQPVGSPVHDQLAEQSRYDVEQTCATDGACQAACPIWIDTGQLVVALRSRRHTDADDAAALWLAGQGEPGERLARGLLRAAVSGAGPAAGTEPGLRPSADAAPGPGSAVDWSAAAAVYFPACASRLLPGAPGTGLPLPDALRAVSGRAGLPLWVPPDTAGLCCSAPWGANGYQRAQEQVAAALADALWRWTGQGTLPVVIDAASCSYTLLHEVGARLDGERRERYAALRVLDAIDWVHDRVLPAVRIAGKVGSVTLYPPCSARRQQLDGKLAAIAAALAEDVTVPVGASCCGMGGDRGLRHPELPAAALRGVSAELAGSRHDAYLCASRTCELGLAEVTGHPYQSFVQLLEQLTR